MSAWNTAQERQGVLLVLTTCETTFRDINIKMFSFDFHTTKYKEKFVVSSYICATASPLIEL